MHEQEEHTTASLLVPSKGSSLKLVRSRKGPYAICNDLFLNKAETKIVKHYNLLNLGGGYLSTWYVIIHFMCSNTFYDLKITTINPKVSLLEVSS